MRLMSLILTLGSVLVTFSACSPQSLTGPRAVNSLNAASRQPSGQSQLRSREGLRQGVIQLRRIRFDKWDLMPKDDNLGRDEVSDQNLRLPGLINGFNDYDGNRDGRISFNEFLREDVIAMWSDIYADITDNEFIARDSDGNNQLEGAELQSLRELFSRWPELKGGDSNGDGRVSFDEFQDSYMQVAPWLSRTSSLPQG